jgi:hypothetical protein
MLSRKGEMKCEPNTNIITASVTIDFVKKKKKTLRKKERHFKTSFHCDLIRLKKPHYIPFSEK